MIFSISIRSKTSVLADVVCVTVTLMRAISQTQGIIEYFYVDVNIIRVVLNVMYAVQVLNRKHGDNLNMMHRFLASVSKFKNILTKCK